MFDYKCDYQHKAEKWILRFSLSFPFVLVSMQCTVMKRNNKDIR